MNGLLVRGGGDERDGTVCPAALPQPSTKTHLHRGDCLHKLFICWVTRLYFTSTQVLKRTSVWLASSLRVIFWDNFSPFYAPRWLQKILRLQTSSGVQINAHPERTSINFLQFFLRKTLFFLFTCVYSRLFTVNTTVPAARVAVALSVHQRTVLCPQQAQAAIWAQGVAQHPLGCVRPAYK